MASANKGRVIHRETFQNSNQLVEVLIRTKPKLTTVGASVQKKSTFKRNCPLKNHLDPITEDNPSTNQHHQRVSGSNKQDTQNSHKKLSNDMVVEVSKSKRNSKKKSSLATPDKTWSDVFKSYSSIRDEESINESTSSNTFTEDHTDHVPSKGPKTREGCSQANRSVQTSQFLPRSKEYSGKAFQLDRPSFTDKETTVPLHMQVLSENFVNVGQNNHVLQKLYQSQQERMVNLPPGPQTSNHQHQTAFLSNGHHTNAAFHQERVDRILSGTRQENTHGQIPTAEEARLLSDGLSSTPFSDSALQLLQQLRQKLHLRGDSESSEMLGVLEQFLVSGAPVGRRQQHLPSSPDQSLYNTVFNTPAAPSGNTIGYPQPDCLHQHRQPHQLSLVSYQPHPENRHYAAHTQQQPCGPGSAHQAQYTQQGLRPPSGEPTDVPPQYVEQLRRQLSEQQLVAQQQAATIAELRSLSSRLLALHGKTAENLAIQPTKNTAVQTTENPAVQVTRVPASRAPSYLSPILSTAATACSSLEPDTLNMAPSPHLQPSHAAPPQPDIAPQREDGSSRTTPAAPDTQHSCHKHHLVSDVRNGNVYPLAAAVENCGRGASNTRGVTFGSLPQEFQLHGTDVPKTTANPIRASDRVLENERGNRFPHELLLSDENVERNNHNNNRASQHHSSTVEQGRLPDQLPSAGWASSDPPGDRRPPIPLPPARGVPSASSADDRMQRAALWSMHCENEMLKRQLREARHPAQLSCVATTAEAVANPSTSALPSDLLQQQPLTSTRRSPPVSQAPDDHVGDSDSAFDERTSSKLGSKRPSPSENNVAPHLLGLSSVPHAVPHSDSAAFRVTNTLPTNMHFGGTRSTFRSTAPLANVAATGVDTDMLRTTRERQLTTLNPSVCNASTIPNTVLRDRQQPSSLESPPSSSIGLLASNTSCVNQSTDRSRAELTNSNYMNLYISAVGQHAPSRLHEVEQHSEVVLSSFSALSEDEESLVPNASNHYVSSYNSGTIEVSTSGERFADSARESARPVAKFSSSASAISSCSMAQSIARQGEEGETPLIVPRPLESTRLQDTRPRVSGRSSERSSQHSSRSLAASSDAKGGHHAVPGRSASDASSQFQTLTLQEYSSVDTLT